MSRGRCSTLRQAARGQRGRSVQSGITLINVMVALVVGSLGVLSMVRLMSVATGATTQNQIVSSISTLGNGFWGVVQANPTLLSNAGMVGTFTASTASGAPAALQPWLNRTLAALPAGSVTIATGADAASGLACSATTGCTVTLTMSWNQVATPGIAASTRSQVLNFQFGL